MYCVHTRSTGEWLILFDRFDIKYEQHLKHINTQGWNNKAWMLISIVVPEDREREREWEREWESESERESERARKKGRERERDKGCGSPLSRIITDHFTRDRLKAVCVCLYLCVCVCVCVYVGGRWVFVCLLVCLFVFVCECHCVYLCVCVRACVRACVFVWVRLLR